MTKVKIPKHMRKCKECPYKLGLIKGVTSPCPDCIASGEKNDPFRNKIKSEVSEMANMQFSRTQKCCLLCKHWNGAIGSTTIGIVRGGMLFTADNSEKHSCFKKGSGIETLATYTCQYFKQRYED